MARVQFPVTEFFHSTFLLCFTELKVEPMFSTLSYDAVSFAALFCCFVLALGWVTTGILAKLRVKPPWRNWLARSAVNRKVGGSSPPGGDFFSFIKPIDLKT